VSGRPEHERVIRARWIVPLAGPPLSGGWLRVRRGRVVALGTGAPPGGLGPPPIDVGDQGIVIPGLVNAHTHLEFSDLDRPLDAAGGLPGWIERLIALRRGRSLTEADDTGGAALRRGLEESASHGVTAVGEIATRVPAGGYPGSGPRVRVFREALGLSPAAAAGAGRGAIRDVQRLLAVGAAAGMSPHAPYSVAAPLATMLVAAARDCGVPLAMHVAESEAEAELLGTATGPFRELFERLGVWPPAIGPSLLPAADWISRLARGPRGIVVHGTFLGRDADAWARLVRHRDRLCVAVCPRTNLALSGTLPPIGDFRAAGVRVTIGTDSRASSPDLSVLAECRTLVSAGLASPAEALRMATVDAAWALGFERSCGLLAPGRPADLAVLATNASVTDPYEAILDPTTRITATLRGGRVIAGALAAD
jgi:cytosine/adenosine deaminase-related metal-dependent hydrolase